jgi:hypothetical protein
MVVLTEGPLAWPGMAGVACWLAGPPAEVLAEAMEGAWVRDEVV